MTLNFLNLQTKHWHRICSRKAKLWAAQTLPSRSPGLSEVRLPFAPNNDPHFASASHTETWL